MKEGFGFGEYADVLYDLESDVMAGLFTHE